MILCTQKRGKEPENNGSYRNNELQAQDFERTTLAGQAGMRFWLVENLSLGLAVNYNMSAMATSPAGYNLDVITANVNLRYMWPL